MELTFLSGKGFFHEIYTEFSEKKNGIAGAGLCGAGCGRRPGDAWVPDLGTEAGQEARLEGQESQLESGAERDAAGTGENAVLDAYPEEEFFETETDMTEFEGRLEDIRA